MRFMVIVKASKESEAGKLPTEKELTAMGKSQLSREQDRWSQMVDAIGRVMNPSPAREK